MPNHLRYVGAKDHKITMNADTNLTPSLASRSNPASSIQHTSHGLNYRNSELAMLTALQPRCILALPPIRFEAGS